MNNSNVKNSRKSLKRAFQKPRLKNLGSVKQLTLKIGSVSDGMGPHPA